MTSLFKSLRALFDKDVDSASLFLRTKALINPESLEEDKKVMCQVLGKLYIPDDVDDDKIRTLKLLVNNMISVSVFTTTVHMENI